MTPRLLELGEDRFEGCFVLRRRLRQPVASSTDRRLESPRLDRLEQIVDRVHFERADGMLVVRGDEDDPRASGWREGADHTEPIELRHLHVEEYQVRFLLEQHSDRILAIATLR